MSTDLITKLAGRRVVASVSGGKDSAALSLWLTEQGIEHDRVFADTGWEHPATYGYLWDVLVPTLGPITVVRGKWTMEELASALAMAACVGGCVKRGRTIQRALNGRPSDVA